MLIIIIPSWLYVFYSLSAFHKFDQKTFNTTDQLITFSIYIIFMVIMYIFYFILQDILGLTVSNPISIIMYCILFVIFLFFLIPRYKTVTRIKILGFIISSLVFVLFGTTFGVYNTLLICKDSSSVGVKDPFYITLGMYVLWILLFSFLLYAEGNGMKPTKILGFSSPIAIFILYYTWKRCNPEEKTGNPNINKEANWIYSTTNIAIIAAYICLILGNYLSCLIIGIMAFSMLDQCAPKNDSRVISVAPTLFCFLILAYIRKLLSKSPSPIVSV